MRRLLRYCLSGVLVLAMAWGCSTKNPKWANIQYHNTTTHFNVWWNGNESLKEGVESLSRRCQDDYTQILPVCQLGTKEDAMAVYPQLDRAIEKGIKGIKKHSMLINGQEYVPYIKKCYLLTAYASFYKHDYVSASNTCDLVANQFAGTSEGDEASVLRARCMAADGQFADAETELELLVTRLSKGGFSVDQKEHLYLALAECLLPQEKYKKGVQYLKLAIEECSDSRTKARLYFIMAQVYQKAGKRATAQKYFEKVLRYPTDYVMEFNAKINIASCASLEGGDVSKLERTLDKMLSDKKNEEFRDQIYHAKGEMYMGMKDAQKACDNFRLATAAAQSGSSGKARSALRMGEVLYEVYENYDLSQIYYDTAIRIITQSYPHYADIKNRYDMLSLLVSYTRVIDRNDSLQALADLSPAERTAWAKQKIETLRKEEEEAKERALIEQFEAESKAQLNTLTGDWYFYNSNTVQRGKEQFKQRWGVRQLEDLWFLSQKGSMGLGLIPGMDEPADNEEESDDVADSADNDTIKLPSDNPDDPHCMAYYLKDLPATEAERDSMNLQTAVCLLNAGYIYNEGLKNTPRALDCYLRLANNFSDYDDIVQAFYQLYLIYDKQGNTPTANYYKEMILMGFPDSDFANMIRDREYYKEIIKREQRAQHDYQDVYDLFRHRHYNDVVAAVDDAVETYPGNPLLGRFLYWKGLSLARQNRVQPAVSVFQSIVQTYPATDSIVPLAQAQLDYLMDGGSLPDNDESSAELAEKPQNADTSTKPAQAQQQDEPEGEKALSAEAQLFRYRDKMQHYVVILVNDKRVRATELQIQVANFNAKYYANSGYKVSTSLFTDSLQLLTIHRFVDGSEAFNYYLHLLQPDGPLSNYSQSDYTLFPITTQNYTTFYKRKDIEAYLEFFHRYYNQ